MMELFSEKGGVVFNRFTCFLPSGVLFFQNLSLPACFHSFIYFPRPFSVLPRVASG